MSNLAEKQRIGVTAFSLVAISLLWIVLDRITKKHFASLLAVGEIAPDNWGIVQFRLVHNTGAAWGMFGESTLALGILSLLVCFGVSGYVIFNACSLNKLQVLGASLVVAGGIGNVIDRFGFGYVIDFIEVTFISFPVFNIADIGVTCGFVLFVLGFLLREIKQKNASDLKEAQSEFTQAEMSEGLAKDRSCRVEVIAGEVILQSIEARSAAPASAPLGASVPSTEPLSNLNECQGFADDQSISEGGTLR